MHYASTHTALLYAFSFQTSPLYQKVHDASSCCSPWGSDLSSCIDRFRKRLDCRSSRSGICILCLLFQRLYDSFNHSIPCCYCPDTGGHMLESSLYQMIDRRKSIRRFDGSIPLEKLDKIRSFSDIASHLISIRSKIRIVPASQTSCRRGEYCINYYSEESYLSLIDAGYYLEQIDLYAESIGIGVCWYGFGRTKENELDGLSFRIMLNIGEGAGLRSDRSQFNRIDSSLFWQGDGFEDVRKDVRLAPSACNSQPWKAESHDNTIEDTRGNGKPSLLKGPYKKYFNSIDMGIFLCFLELSLSANGYAFERKLLDGSEKIAEYIARKQR